ncbi:MAG: methyltransferase domain-containing protein [Halocynthiibacter sp.]
MTTPPKLTDPKRLLHNRARAKTSFVRFLHDEALFEIQERLIEVNRTFTNPAVVAGFPDIWGDVVPNAVVVPDEEVIALAPNSHDLVIHAMGLHWANDPIGQLIQCHRALKKDGLMIAICFGGQTLMELRSALAEAESEVYGGLSPRILPMGEIRDLGGLLQRAGFALPVADAIPLNTSYKSAMHLMHELRGMGETNAMAARNTKPVSKVFFERVENIYRAHFPADDNRVRATFELVCLTGWAPDESQQKPLRPGSAAHRLADALGTSETEI